MRFPKKANTISGSAGTPGNTQSNQDKKNSKNKRKTEEQSNQATVNVDKYFEEADTVREYKETDSESEKSKTSKQVALEKNNAPELRGMKMEIKTLCDAP